jgi:hypothetical protein
MVQWMSHYIMGPGGEPPIYGLDLSAVRPDEKKEDEDAQK